MAYDQRIENGGYEARSEHTPPCPGLEAVQRLVDNVNLEKLKQIDVEKLNKSGTLNTVLLLIFSTLVGICILIVTSAINDVKEVKTDTSKFQKEIERSVSSLDKNVFAFIETSKLIMQSSAEDRKETKSKLDEHIEKANDYRKEDLERRDYRTK